MRLLLILLSILTFAYMISGEVSNNTSYIYNDSPSLYNDPYNRTPDTYKVLVDGYYGFYRMYDVNTGEEIINEEYEDKTLRIRIGDTVIWSNEDPVEYFTVMSDPQLWTYRVGFLHPGKRFNYTFNRYGMYYVYIQQRLELSHQIIIVDSLNLTSNNTTIEKVRENTINKTIIFKKKGNQSINSTNNQKSKVDIKIYREPKKIPGFEIIIIMSIAIIIYMFKKK